MDGPQIDFQRIMNGPHVSIRNDKNFEMTCGTPKASPRPALAAPAGKNHNSNHLANMCNVFE